MLRTLLCLAAVAFVFVFESSNADMMIMPRSANAPVAVGTIPSQALEAGGAPVTVNVSDNFSDADNDNLTYTAASSDATVAAGSVAGSTVTITPVSAGSATITVKASDPGGLSATQLIPVIVESPDDEPNGKRTTRTVSVGGNATGIIETSGDKDWFRVTLVSEIKYRFDLESAVVGGETVLGDPRIVFRNISTSRIGFDNSGGAGKNARLEYTVPAGGGGVYFLVAMGQRESTGGYRLSVAAVNRAPVPVGNISPQTLTAGNAAGVVNVSGKFSDPEGDALTYSVSASNSTFAAVSVSNSTVSIAPLAAGTFLVEVTASDPARLNAIQAFLVTVLPHPNRPPESVGSISNLEVSVGESAGAVDVSGNFSDPDGDTLAYTAESSNTAIAVTRVLNSTVIVTPLKGGVVTVTVTASDPNGRTATQIFSVTVPNRAPFRVGLIGASTLWVGDVRTVHAERKFIDPDGDALTYEGTLSGPQIAVPNVSGSTVTFAIVGVGTATFIVTARDPGGRTATQTFTVTVPNRIPASIGNISNRTLWVGDAATVNVSGNFSDPDRHALTYTATSSNTAVATTRVSGSEVTINPVALGTATITVTATDPPGLKATQSFSVTIPNRPPTPNGSISNRRLYVGQEAAVDVSGNFSDPDRHALTYTATSSKAAVAALRVSGNSVTITAVTPGIATITVTATDPLGLKATQSFSATIPNRAPTPNGSISNRELWVGDAATVEVSGKFSDPDRHALTYTATSSNTAAANLRVSGSVVTINPVALGTATITVTATDPPGLKTTQSFLVTIPNRAPSLNGSISNRTLWIGDEVTVNVSGKFSDPDRHALTYTATSSNTAAATLRVSGSMLTITPANAGTATITVTATDPLGMKASQIFSVDVRRRISSRPRPLPPLYEEWPPCARTGRCAIP